MHFPHFDFNMGLPISRGASVKTDDSLSADPYSFVVNNADFPIHPSPARVAIVLCGSSNELNSPKSVPNLFFVCAYALYPLFIKNSSCI